MSMQRQGGIARAAKLTPQRRSDIARAGAVARWGKPRAEKPKPVTAPTKADIDTAETALILLQSIRTQFRKLGCPKTAERIELAVSSAKGAVRNLRNKADRARMEADNAD
jgi:hypothetical protein